MISLNIKLPDIKKHGGYEVLKKAFGMNPKDIIAEVKRVWPSRSRRSRFSHRNEVGFLPDNGEERYLLCNADEGEPGTFKDRLMMEKLLTN